MKNECQYWTPTSDGPKGCTLKRGHDGEHYCTVRLHKGTPMQFSGFGIGKMRLYAPKNEPRIVAECWTCTREPLIVCRINPDASDRFYRRPHFPHRPECYETQADVRIKLTESSI